MPSHLTAELRGFVTRWLPRAPASVLDVGCGDGESTRWLAANGFGPLGVDPEAPEEAGFVRARIQDFDRPDGPFDAALALRSLHHAGGLDAAVDAIAAALRPGARLVVFEYAIEAVDERALRWAADRGLPTPVNPRSGHDVTPLADVRAAIESRFTELAAEPAAYLAREGGRPELERAELEAIAAGEIAAAGARLAYETA